MRVRLRPEFEYFYRASRYDQTADIPFATGASGDKIRQEIRMATDRIGTLAGHNLFGNLYLDFTNRSHFTPYAGFGMGIGSAKMEYTSVWSRNADPTAISTGEGLPNVEQIRRTLPERPVSPRRHFPTPCSVIRCCSEWTTKSRSLCP